MADPSFGFAGRVKPLILIAPLLCTAFLAACGESAEEKAKAQVCNARADISKQITALQGLTFSTSVLSEAQTHFEAIGKDLTKIKDAQPKLEPARKEQVQSATTTFETELNSIASGVATSLGSGNLEARLKSASPQLKSALSQLGADYKRSLGPISCP